MNLFLCMSLSQVQFYLLSMSSEQNKTIKTFEKIIICLHQILPLSYIVCYTIVNCAIDVRVKRKPTASALWLLDVTDAYVDYLFFLAKFQLLLFLKYMRILSYLNTSLKPQKKKKKLEPFYPPPIREIQKHMVVNVL